MVLASLSFSAYGDRRMVYRARGAVNDKWHSSTLTIFVAEFWWPWRMYLCRRHRLPEEGYDFYRCAMEAWSYQDLHAANTQANRTNA